MFLGVGDALNSMIDSSGRRSEIHPVHELRPSGPFVGKTIAARNRYTRRFPWDLDGPDAESVAKHPLNDKKNGFEI
jgi:hypothetical protein